MTTDILTLTSCKNAATVSLPDSHEEPINILIVDDEPKNLTVLQTILDDPGNPRKLSAARSSVSDLIAG